VLDADTKKGIKSLTQHENKPAAWSEELYAVLKNLAEKI